MTVTEIAGFYDRTDAVIVIPAEATTGTDTAIVVAVGNTTDAPDRTETVTATIGNGRAEADSTTMSVTGAGLTIEDDDAAPGVTLALDPASVSENGGVATVSATLSHPSSQPSTVTVTPVSGAYTAGSDSTIVIAAGSTTAASDTATVAAVDDDVHQGSAGRSATVTAALTNGQGEGAVTGAALTLTDDETLPTVALALSSTSISETGGISTVTAKLSGPSSAAVTVTVAAAAGGRRDRGRLHPEHGDDLDHRGGGDDQRGHGDGDRERQRRGFAQQVGDGLGNRVGGQRGSRLRRT